jgi:hypothetical protein
MMTLRSHFSSVDNCSSHGKIEVTALVTIDLLNKQIEL